MLCYIASIGMASDWIVTEVDVLFIKMTTTVFFINFNFVGHKTKC